jgi:hypothetical protein
MCGPELADDVAATLRPYTYEPEVRRVGMAHVRITDDETSTRTAITDYTDEDIIDCIDTFCVTSLPTSIPCQAGRSTATGMHVRGYTWPSYNYRRSCTTQIWLTIDPASTCLFEAIILAQFPDQMTLCGQEVWHLEKLFPPQLLDSWNVKYHVTVCRPGELILIMPDVFYQVLHFGTEFVEWMESPVIASSFDSYRPVAAPCRVEPVPTQTQNVFILPDNSRKQKAATDRETHTVKRRRHEDHITLDDFDCSGFVVYNRPYIDPAATLAALLSKQVISCLAQGIDACRAKYSEHAFNMYIFNDARDLSNLAAQYDRGMKSSYGLEKYLNGHCFSGVLWDMTRGGVLLKNKDLDKLAAKCEQTYAEPNFDRASMRDRVYERAKVFEMCQVLGTGVLPLLTSSSEPPCHMSEEHFFDTTPDDLDRWELLVKNQLVSTPLARLCRIGQSIVDMVMTGQPTLFKFDVLPDFQNTLTTYLEKLRLRKVALDLSTALSLALPPAGPSKQDTLHVLGCFDVHTPVDSNLFAEDRHQAPASSPSSPWESLQDPTMVGGPCSGCLDGKECTCCTDLTQDRYRVAVCPRGKSVVVARSPTGQSTVFDAGSYVGELVGDFHLPTNQDCHGPFLKILKPASESQPLHPPGSDCIAHLHWYQTANWTRFITHSCQPSTMFELRNLGGRLRVLLKATHDIVPGTIFTADYTTSGIFEVSDKVHNCAHCGGSCKPRKPKRPLASH